MHTPAHHVPCELVVQISHTGTLTGKKPPGKIKVVFGLANAQSPGDVQRVIAVKDRRSPAFEARFAVPLKWLNKRLEVYLTLDLNRTGGEATAETPVRHCIDTF
jgi:hypothetical protein